MRRRRGRERVGGGRGKGPPSILQLLLGTMLLLASSALPLCLLSIIIITSSSRQVGAFRLLPDLPSFRHHLFFHPATPAPSERAQNSHPPDAEEGLSVMDIARRRLWRWSVWRRLYHSSVVTVLKQQPPSPSEIVSWTRRKARLESSRYTQPIPFQFSPPDAGTVTVASTGSFNSVHLVTRAASPEQKSLVYVNGTEVSGHLRSSISIPSSPLLSSIEESNSHREGTPRTRTCPSISDPLSLSLVGEFCIQKPAYLHIAPVRAGSKPLLWVTQFSITRRGSVSGINIFGRQPMEMQLGYTFRWPNEVYNLAPGTIAGASEEALLVADGFLMPGRSDGGLYVVQEPGRPNEKVTRLTKHRPGWFYHKAAWVDLMGNGRPCALTARATKPFFAQTEGELVLLLQPDGPFPLAEWNTPWREIILVKGPDVMFDVVDLDPDDDIIEVFAAEFFSRRLTLHRIRKGDWRSGRLPRVLTSEVLDDSLGPAYSVVLADLKGQGKPSHVLVSSHECEYEGFSDGGGSMSGGSGAGDEEVVCSGETGFASSSSRGEGGSVRDGGGEEAGFSTSRGEEGPEFFGPGLQGFAGVSDAAAAAAGGRRRIRGRRRGRSGPSSSPSSSLGAEDLKGGSLFAYEIPSRWRQRVQWKRTVIATGFHVRTWGQINPGAPGFPYVFFPHKGMQGTGQRPHILLAGDCSHAAYVYRPIGEGDDEIKYEPMAQINCGGTVGSLAVGYLPLFGQKQEDGGEPAAEEGWAKLLIPNFDTDKVYCFAFGPDKALKISPSEAKTVPPERVEKMEAERLARVQEEEEVIHASQSYGRARGEKTKLS